MSIQALDEAVRATVHGWSSPALTAAMLWLTNVAAQWLVLPLAVLVALRLSRQSRTAGWLFAAVVLGGELGCEVLKLAVRRPRPDPFFGVVAPGSYSFPSGHAFRSVTFYGMLAFSIVTRLRSPGTRAALWAAVVLIAAVAGFSRVYLGVHYPSDVLAGYSLAVAWVALWRRL